MESEIKKTLNAFERGIKGGIKAAKRTTTTKDYLARMKRFQPNPLSAAAAKALQEKNRGDR